MNQQKAINLLKQPDKKFETSEEWLLSRGYRKLANGVLVSTRESRTLEEKERKEAEIEKFSHGDKYHQIPVRHVDLSLPRRDHETPWQREPWKQDYFESLYKKDHGCKPVRLPGSKNKQTRIAITFSGRVQGVGFRHSVISCVEKSNLQVTGFVRNLPDENVYAVFQGKLEDIQKVYESIFDKCHGARIDKTTVKVLGYVDGEFGFYQRGNSWAKSLYSSFKHNDNYTPTPNHEYRPNANHVAVGRANYENYQKKTIVIDSKGGIPQVENERLAAIRKTIADYQRRQSLDDPDAQRSRFLSSSGYYE